MALAGLQLWGLLRPVWLSGDEAYYVGVARSLAEGRGYVFDGVPHAIFPPGYPLVLAPVVALVGVEADLLQLFTLIVGWVALAGVALYLRCRGAAAAVTPALIVMFSSIAVFEVFTDLRSEGLFLLTLAATLAAGELFIRWPTRLETGVGTAVAGVSGGGAVPRSLLVWAAVFGGLAGVAVPAVRSAGVALPVAAALTAVALALRGRVRRGVGAAPTFLAGIVSGSLLYQLWWGARTARFGEERSYSSLLVMVDPHHPDLGAAGAFDVVSRIIEQFGVQSARLVELVTNLRGVEPFLFGLPHLLILIAVARGLFDELRRPNPLAGWFFVVYLGIVVLWPFDEGTRFLLPLFPLILLFGFRGCMSLAAQSPTRTGWRRMAAAAALVAVVHAGEVALRTPTPTQGVVWVLGWASLALAALALSRMEFRPRWCPAPTSIAAFGVVLHLALGLPSLFDRASRQRAGGQKFAETQIHDAIPWIRAHTDSSAVLAGTTETQGIALHTGRRTHRLPTTGDATRLWDTLDRAGADFLVVPKAHESPYFLPTGDARLEALSRARPGRLTLVHEYSMGRIFAVDAGS